MNHIDLFEMLNNKVFPLQPLQGTCKFSHLVQMLSHKKLPITLWDLGNIFTAYVDCPFLQNFVSFCIIYLKVKLVKQKGEPLGIVLVESGWGSMLPTVVLANLMPSGPAARTGRLNIGDQIMSIDGNSLVGLPLSACQSFVKVYTHCLLSAVIIINCIFWRSMRRGFNFFTCNLYLLVYNVPCIMYMTWNDNTGLYCCSYDVGIPHTALNLTDK